MREVEDSARGKWWPLPFSARAETAVSTAFMGGFHGRAFFNRSSTRLEPSGKGKRRGAAGTVAPRRPANGLGMRKAMEEIWEIYPWLSIRVPFSRTARRGRPCLACGRLGEAVPAGGCNGRDGRSAPSGEWVGDEEGHGRNLGNLPMAFHSRSILADGSERPSLPSMRTARRGRPCHASLEDWFLPFHVHPCRSGGRQTYGHSS